MHLLFIVRMLYSGLIVVYLVYCNSFCLRLRHIFFSPWIFNLHCKLNLIILLYSFYKNSSSRSWLCVLSDGSSWFVVCFNKPEGSPSGLVEIDSEEIDFLFKEQVRPLNGTSFLLAKYPYMYIQCFWKKIKLV